MSRTRVKVCGITRPGDAITAAHLGVDAIGLVFYPKSSRLIDADAARRIIAALPPFITTVGLFLDAEHHEVTTVLETVPLDLLQFHGDEDPAYCRSFGRPFIKAVPMAEAADPGAYAQRFATAQALLLDSHGGGRIGGTGEAFDWNRIPPRLAKPLILAGGLNPHSVSDAIRRVHPYGVDVSSGVESAKGVKDAGLMRDFMRGVHHGDQHH